MSASPFVLRDWRAPGDVDVDEKPIVHPDGLPMLITLNSYGTYDIQIGLAPKMRRFVTLELEGDELRVRLYADESLAEEPAGEMRLLSTETKARYGTEFD